MPPSSGARFYVACAKGPAESGVACLLAPRRERRGFSLGPLSISSAAVHACSGDVANAQIPVIPKRRGGVNSTWANGRYRAPSTNAAAARDSALRMKLAARWRRVLMICGVRPKYLLHFMNLLRKLN
jgi:hypothetical protein